MSSGITLAILAFNHAAFIEKAILSALKQDFGDFELLISDDGSTDDTMLIAERTIAKFADERQRVIYNRRKGGQGLVAHIDEIARIASGELIVILAGDDLCEPERVKTIDAYWRDDRPDILISDYFVIDEFGHRIQPELDLSPTEICIFNDQRTYKIVGCTAAYSKRFLAKVPQPQNPVYMEDFYYTLCSSLSAITIVRIPQPLVGYRLHSASISTSTLTTGREEVERKGAQVAALGVQTIDAFRDAIDLAGQSRTLAGPNDRRLLELRAQAARHAQWIETSTLRRFIGLVRHPADFRWTFPRLLGLNRFLQIARFADRMRFLLR